ncbi:MAG: hypothetical protein DID92_2727743573 [Candidatus Nitrotoga sp. SPKER]|nr:MAG: hypothetical protein DID92_2727743573 [Candidatus Nitrotoga sp. SPKER]
MGLLDCFLVFSANKNNQILMPRHISSFRLTKFFLKHTLLMQLLKT